MTKKNNKKENGVLGIVDWCRRLAEALVLLVIGLTTLAIAICWGCSHVIEAIHKDFAQPRTPITTSDQKLSMSSQDR